MGQTGIKKRRKKDYKNERRQKVIERQAYRRDRLKFKKIQNQPTRKSPYKQTNKPNELQQTATALHSFPKITTETRAGTKVSEINFIV